MYSTDIPSIPEEFGNLDFDTISDTEIEKLMTIPSEQEIKTCIQSLHPLKAPGPDGFPGIFYRHYWEIIRIQVVKYVQECFRTKKVTKGLNPLLFIFRN